MTKITVLGSEATEKKELKKIKFVKYIDEYGENSDFSSSPSEWENIELICRNYRNRENDLMFCFNNQRNGKSNAQQAIFLGHFNDGVV